MMSIIDRARPEIRAMQAYASARSTATALGVEATIQLDANENPWPPLADDTVSLNRYPDPQPAGLRSELAGLYGVDPHSILVTRGSDEAIDLLVRAFCRAGQDAVVQCSPCFGMYAIPAGIQGARLVDVPLREDEGFALPGKRLLAACADDTVRLLFLCSPNNPTGSVMDVDAVRALCESLAGQVLVVVDEAYAEFSRAPQLVGEAGRIENLAVLRTLSKAWGLAGARCGALIAAPAVIELLRRIIPPYPLPTPTVRAAERVIADPVASHQRIERIVAAREQAAARLARFPWVRQVFPSEGNFLLVKLDDARGVYEFAASRGVLLRDFSSKPGLAGCLRISIGSEAEMTRLFEILEEWPA